MVLILYADTKLIEGNWRSLFKVCGKAIKNERDKESQEPIAFFYLSYQGFCQLDILKSGSGEIGKHTPRKRGTLRVQVPPPTLMVFLDVLCLCAHEKRTLQFGGFKYW